MTPNLILLYAASIACIALLAGFARHNRKTGWVKKRSSILQEISALHQSWEEMDRDQERSRPAAPAMHSLKPTLQTTAAFSVQLANLQSSLEFSQTVRASSQVEQLVTGN